MTFSAPTLPHPYLINNKNHIPPPPTSSFTSTFSFSGLLPPGESIPSSWGTTHYYSFPPSSPSSSTPPKRILLVHGGGTSAIGLAPLARILSSSGYNHVVIYDLFGHGLSSTPLTTHNTALFHGQILELINWLGWTKCHVLGFSIGGGIAVSFAAVHRRAVESLILVAPAGLWRKKERSWWDWATMDGFNLPGLEWLRRSRVIGYVHGVNPVVKEGWQERMKKGEMDTVVVEQWERENHGGHVASLVSMWNYGGCFDEHLSYGKVSESGIDTLVILGDKDTVIELEDTKKELGMLGWKGEIKVVEGATHQIVRENRKEVAALCIEFWGKL